jgi:hypothetical protein
VSVYKTREVGGQAEGKVAPGETLSFCVYDNRNVKILERPKK